MDHQIKGARGVKRLLLQGLFRILVVSPPGSGKTKLMIWFLYWLVDSGIPVLLIVPKGYILDQFLVDLDALGLEYGIIRSGCKENRGPLIQIGTYQTLIRRNLPPAKYVFIDEAHRTMCDSIQKIIDHYSNPRVLGFSGSPCRSDGRPLGGPDGFQAMFECSTVQELIDCGMLVKGEYYGADIYPDLSEVEKSGADYNQEQLSRKANTTQLNGEAVKLWLELAKGFQTIVFSVDIKHGYELEQKFNATGYSFCMIDYKTPKKKLDQILYKFRQKLITGIVNCGKLGEGLDISGIDCLVDCKPTLSPGNQIQKWGRPSRCEPGKDKWICIDIANNIETHSFSHTLREWNLEKKRKAKLEPIRRCPMCYRLAEGKTKVCFCGYEWKTETEGMKKRSIEVVEQRFKKVEEEDLIRKEIFSICLKVSMDLYRNIDFQQKAKQLTIIKLEGGLLTQREELAYSAIKNGVTDKQRGFLLGLGYSAIEINGISKKKAGYLISLKSKVRI